MRGGGVLRAAPADGTFGDERDGRCDADGRVAGGGRIEGLRESGVCAGKRRADGAVAAALEIREIFADASVEFSKRFDSRKYSVRRVRIDAAGSASAAKS